MKPVLADPTRAWKQDGGIKPFPVHKAYESHRAYRNSEESTGLSRTMPDMPRLPPQAMATAFAPATGQARSSTYQYKDSNSIQDELPGSSLMFQPLSKSPELRVNQKLAERKRRTEMKELFDQLNDSIPQTAEKRSKWEILTCAIEERQRQQQHIALLQEQLADIFKEQEWLKLEMEKLRKENAHLHSEDTRYVRDGGYPDRESSISIKVNQPPPFSRSSSGPFLYDIEEADEISPSSRTPYNPPDDLDSCYSDVDSILSAALTTSTADSSVMSSAFEELYIIISRDEELEGLFAYARSHVETDVFRRRLAWLILQLGEGLRNESTTENQNQTARFVRANAKKIATRITATSTSISQHLIQDPSYLDKFPESRHTDEQNEDTESTDSSSSSPNDSREVEVLRVFVRCSDAFAKLRAELRTWLNVPYKATARIEEEVKREDQEEKGVQGAPRSEFQSLFEQGGDYVEEWVSSIYVESTAYRSKQGTPKGDLEHGKLELMNLALRSGPVSRVSLNEPESCDVSQDPTTELTPTSTAEQESPFPALERLAYWMQTSLNLVTSILRSPIPEGHSRVSWKCLCGDSMSIDVQAEKLNAALKFAHQMAGATNGETIRVYSSQSSLGSNTTTNSNSSQDIERSISSSSTPPDPEAIELDNRTSSAPGEHVNRYLLFCADSGSTLQAMEHIDLTAKLEDGELWDECRTAYQRIRNRNDFGWRNWIQERFFQLRQLKLSGTSACIIDPDSVPPLEELKHGNYCFSALDLASSSDRSYQAKFFMHCFLKAGDHTSNGSSIAALPKKLREELRVLRDGSSNVAWGIYIENDTDLGLLAVIMVACLLMTTFITCIWCGLMNDVQGGTGIGQYILGAASIIYALSLGTRR
ncbi:uncharacterized protein JN550_000609 [Neoarthrinium moseri]|uniref:uncharacterized protein n=1 Tax=Neoarthrinium moseri TaxID=1658444 RepID=UPI001FDD81FC|nr:uncharacterized protein JN550_000609 [Neoarthrinium moseri]KAI1878427.1 hypothetical protein JN550_000609 [Neoarthrinium moseri]